MQSVGVHTGCHVNTHKIVISAQRIDGSACVVEEEFIHRAPAVTILTCNILSCAVTILDKIFIQFQLFQNSNLNSQSEFQESKNKNQTFFYLANLVWITQLTVAVPPNQTRKECRPHVKNHPRDDDHVVDGDESGGEKRAIAKS